MSDPATHDFAIHDREEDRYEMQQRAKERLAEQMAADVLSNADRLGDHLAGQPYTMRVFLDTILQCYSDDRVLARVIPRLIRDSCLDAARVQLEKEQQP